MATLHQTISSRRIRGEAVSSSKMALFLALVLVLSQFGCSSAMRSSSSSSSSLMSASRRLDDGADNDGQQQQAQAQYYDDYFAYDLSQFSVRYEKCQYVKMYDDDMAEDEDYDSPLALKHFVLYRLCPSETCTETKKKSGSYNWSGVSPFNSSLSTISSSGTGCDAEGAVYGKYAVDVQAYLEHTLEYQQRSFEQMCENCMGDNNNNNGDGDDGNNNNYDMYGACSEGDEECMACVDACTQYENLEANGYLDAAQYTECQQLEINNNNDGDDDGNNNGGFDWSQYYKYRNNNNGNDDNGDDNGEFQVYVGPRCNSSGRIVIGLFYDENCWEPIDGVDVEEAMGAKLSYQLLKHSYSNERDGSTCLSCAENMEENDNENDAQDADDVNEMCEDLYNDAAKCETETGLDVGFIQIMRENDEYENQVENEFFACTFINSLIWNSYTETGEINVDAPQDEIVRKVTQKQTVALSVLTLTVCGILLLGYYYDRKIKNLEPPPHFVARGESALT